MEEVKRKEIDELLDLSTERSIRLVVDEEVYNNKIRLLWSFTDIKFTKMKQIDEGIEHEIYIDKDLFQKKIFEKEVKDVSEGSVFRLKGKKIRKINTTTKNKIRKKTNKLLQREFLKPDHFERRRMRK